MPPWQEPAPATELPIRITAISPSAAWPSPGLHLAEADQAAWSACRDRADRAAVRAGHQRRVLGHRTAGVVRRRALPLCPPPFKLTVVDGQLQPPLGHVQEAPVAVAN